MQYLYGWDIMGRAITVIFLIARYLLFLFHLPLQISGALLTSDIETVSYVMPDLGWFRFLLFFSDYNIGEDVIGRNDKIEVGLNFLHVGGNIITMTPGHTL